MAEYHQSPHFAASSAIELTNYCSFSTPRAASVARAFGVSRPSAPRRRKCSIISAAAATFLLAGFAPRPLLQGAEAFVAKRTGSISAASRRQFVCRRLPPTTSLTPTGKITQTRHESTAADDSSTTANHKMDSPYGSWRSPITSQAITAGSVALGSLRVVPTATSSRLTWLEGRSQEGGRYVLCQQQEGGATAKDITPAASNVRTRVHEYGGGAVCWNSDGTTVYYSDFATQRILQLSVDEDTTEPLPVTPDCPNCRYRYADGVYHNGKLICIREDHGAEGKAASKDVVNEIVAIPVAASSSVETEDTIQVLATGNDFFAAPRLSPDGTQLAYITWNHPNMPWDATELRVVSDLDLSTSVSSSPKTSDHKLVAGSDGDTSILQPAWFSDQDLYYLSDETGHYNIFHCNPSSDKTTAKSVNVLPMSFDFGGSAPGWQLSQQGFSFLPSSSKLLATYDKDGATRLVVATIQGEDGTLTAVEEFSGVQHGLPAQFGSVQGAGTSRPDTLYLMGGSPNTPSSIYEWNMAEQGPAKIIKCSSTLSFESNMISIPRLIEFPTTNGLTAFGYYYPPSNANYHCTTEAAPPLLVKAHGGPTACTGTTFNAAIQYWTSRGFAILDVDYGGSTGYGRDYRRRLRKSWGIVDIDDVCAGAQYLVEKGLANGERLCIDGGSAGGYTTLGALAFRNVFTAGCSKYGIGDLTALAGDTHKFESRYLDGLVGPYPADKAVYEERSPIGSVDTLSCPILLLQGTEDQVVPPNQAEMMHEALLKKGIPTCLKMYEGEQHGFRKAENIQDSLDSELAFFGRVFGIHVPDALDLQIDNLEK